MAKDDTQQVKRQEYKKQLLETVEKIIDQEADGVVLVALMAENKEDVFVMGASNGLTRQQATYGAMQALNIHVLGGAEQK